MLEPIAQTPLALVYLYEAHNLVSLVNVEMSHGSVENLDENSASTNDKFLVMI